MSIGFFQVICRNFTLTLFFQILSQRCMQQIFLASKAGVDPRYNPQHYLLRCVVHFSARTTQLSTFVGFVFVSCIYEHLLAWIESPVLQQQSCQAINHQNYTKIAWLSLASFCFVCEGARNRCNEEAELFHPSAKPITCSKDNCPARLLRIRVLLSFFTCCSAQTESGQGHLIRERSQEMHLSLPMHSHDCKFLCWLQNN